MNRRQQFMAALAALAIIGVVQISPAHATAIPLPSTGTDASGNELPGGSLDPHYSVTGPGRPGGGPAVVYSASSLFSGWVPDDPHSAWIGFQDSFSSSPHGDYTYRLTIDLTGYDPTTASLSGSWAADQFGSINLNGLATGVFVPDGNWNAGAFPNLNPFTIPPGLFHSGVNILDFVVTEPDDGDGLRVRNLTLTATPVPEPASIFILLAAAATVSLGLIRRR
jgi:hypothetical protein